ncbi:hypothetical protein ACGFNU_38855 [Spirillospora sp. NPDC048911]|uniref:hypothetical protein n=1 Tax=Spirillospora sp. NPDC048911 TaxID=3364527 RepID=UPI0037110915
MKKGALTTALAGICGTVFVLTSGGASAVASSASALADCQVGSAPSLTYSNVEVNTAFSVSCTTARSVAVRFVVYDAQNAPLAWGDGDVKFVPGDGQWYSMSGHYSWGTPLPVARACEWIDQIGPVGRVELYSACTFS